MAEAIRNLQLFRNGLPVTLVGDVDTLKLQIDTAVANGTLTVHDGEPISIRYKESSSSNTVKGLLGVGYNDGTNKYILWTGEETVLIADNTGHNVTISITENPSGTWTLSADTVFPDVPVYSISKDSTPQSGYLATYHLTKDGIKEGAAINIPKDFLVKSASVKTVVTPDVPYPGAAVGDKYIDFIINVRQESGSGSGSGTPDEHIYIPFKDLVDIYTAGNGIDISNSNVLSVKIADTTTIDLDFNNLNELIGNVKVSSAQGNKLTVKTDGLFASSVTIIDTTVVDNKTGTSSQYWGINHSTDKLYNNTSGLDHSEDFTVPAGKKMLLIATSDYKITGCELVDTDDTYVVSGYLMTEQGSGSGSGSGNRKIRLVRNDSVNVDIDIDTLTAYIDNAVVVWNTSNDTLAVTSDGKLNQAAMTEIERYIDNYDCGTFSLN